MLHIRRYLVMCMAMFCIACITYRTAELKAAPLCPEVTGKVQLRSDSGDWSIPAQGEYVFDRIASYADDDGREYWGLYVKVGDTFVLRMRIRRNPRDPSVNDGEAHALDNCETNKYRGKVKIGSHADLIGVLPFPDVP